MFVKQAKGGGWVALGVLVTFITGLYLGTKALFGYWDGERRRKRLELEKDLQQEELERLRKKGDDLQAKATQIKVKK